MLFPTDAQSVVEHIQPATVHDVVHFIALRHTVDSTEVNLRAQWPGQPLEKFNYPALDQVKTLAAPQSMLTHWSGPTPSEAHSLLNSTF